jgi:PleD family two-component response regulator
LIFFKDINDTYGHPVGDEILKQVAKTIDSIRESDIVTRYGGEEFCVILPDTSPLEAQQVAERMREKIEHTSYKGGRSSKPISLSVSMGVIGLSQLPSWKSSLSYLIQTEPYDDEANRERLRIYEEHLVEEGIAEADKALYVAKRTGRNKVEMWNCNTDILFQGLKQKEE